MAHIRHGGVKIDAILLWFGMDNIYCCLQLRALDALEKVADFCAIVHTTVAIIYKILHDCVLFFVEDDIFVPVPCLSLTIIMGVLQLSFCIYGLPGHMVRAKKLLMDVE